MNRICCEILFSPKWVINFRARLTAVCWRNLVVIVAATALYKINGLLVFDSWLHVWATVALVSLAKCRGWNNSTIIRTYSSTCNMDDTCRLHANTCFLQGNNMLRATNKRWSIPSITILKRESYCLLSKEPRSLCEGLEVHHSPSKRCYQSIYTDSP